MTPRQKKDSAIAAGVTMGATLLLLLLLFTCGLRQDRSESARTSTAGIMTEEEDMFIEPELLVAPDAGSETDRADEAREAPPVAGEPDPAPKEQTRPKLKNDNPDKQRTRPKEELVAEKRPSDVKTRPAVSDEERRRVESMKGKFKSDNNGSRRGKEADAAGDGTDGVGTTGSVAGRKMLSCPSSKVRVSQRSVVRVNITVDATGACTHAKAVSGGTPNLRSVCEGWARRSRWTPRQGAKPASGTITFTITPNS